MTASQMYDVLVALAIRAANRGELGLASAYLDLAEGLIAPHDSGERRRATDAIDV